LLRLLSVTAAIPMITPPRPPRNHRREPNEKAQRNGDLVVRACEHDKKAEYVDRRKRHSPNTPPRLLLGNIGSQLRLRRDRQPPRMPDARLQGGHESFCLATHTTFRLVRNSRRQRKRLLQLPLLAAMFRLGVPQLCQGLFVVA
jgi:hypothetical protein